MTAAWGRGGRKSGTKPCPPRVVPIVGTFPPTHPTWRGLQLLRTGLNTPLKKGATSEQSENQHNGSISQTGGRRQADARLTDEDGGETEPLERKSASKSLVW